MFYLRDTRKHNTLNHRVITNKTYKMTEIDKNLVNDLPFEEIMELINAKHGFFYNKDSKKKLDRYAGKVSRRIVRRSKRKSTGSSKIGWLFGK